MLAPLAAIVLAMPTAAITPQGAAAINARIAALQGRSYSNAVLRLYQKRLLFMLPLIRDGEDINTTKGNDNGSTALHTACGIGDAELVEVLLACGADPSIKTAKGASTELCIGCDPGGRIRKLLRNPKAAKLLAVDAAAGAETTSAAPAGAADCAPADVSGRTVTIIRTAEQSATSDEGLNVWKPSEDKSPRVFKFKQGNSCKPLTGSQAPGPGYGNRATYKKTGPNTATIVDEEWESSTTYTLKFTSPTSGNVTESGEGEGLEWRARGATFVIR